VPGNEKQTAVRIKTAQALGIKLHEPTREKPVVNSPADAATLPAGLPFGLPVSSEIIIFSLSYKGWGSSYHVIQ